MKIITTAALVLLQTNGLSAESALQLGLTATGANGTITLPDVKRFLLGYTAQQEDNNDNFLMFEEEETTPQETKIATAPTTTAPTEELWDFCCYAAQFRNFTAAEIYAQGVAMGLRTVDDVITSNPYGVYGALAVDFRNQK